MTPNRAALTSLVDYAGLFPPAALDLSRVVSNHLRYLRSPERWLLGRLIVPRTRLDELDARLTHAGGEAAAGQALPWTISVLASVDDEALDALGDQVARFNERQPRQGAAVVAVELAVRSVEEIDRAARLVPDRYERYVEVPLDDRLPDLIRAAALAGCYAKVRAGGITADAFPDPAALARFMTLCALHEVPFKATAGLHHPFRGSYPLTYEPQSLCATMHGFLNLAVASALLYTGRIGEAETAAILESGEEFPLADKGIRWQSHRVGGEELSFSRAHLFRSVGSCSFEDAVGDLRRARWIERSTDDTDYTDSADSTA